jgi:6-phosphogluconate dehydrogenase
MATHTIGIIGLGAIGGNLVRQALEKDIHVVGYTKGDAPTDLVQQGMTELQAIDAFCATLPQPRMILLYVPAGPVIDTVIQELAPHLKSGDIIVDGGNSYWGDSQRRAEELRAAGLHFVDMGTSGGVSGARTGACFMAGGDAGAVATLEPVLRRLAVEDGFTYTGGSGSGHFVKLVHNGIEFGMLQAIGEGVHLLSRYQEDLDIPAILNCWAHGSVIRSWLIELLEQVYKEQGSTEAVPPYIEDTGEVNWLVSDALQMEVPTPVINLSVQQLFTSRDDQQTWARAVAMMRHGFGGHPFGKDESIAHKRGTQRVGQIVRQKE